MEPISPVTLKSRCAPAFRHGAPGSPRLASRCPRQTRLLPPGRSARSRSETATQLRAGPVRLPEPHAGRPRAASRAEQSGGGGGGGGLGARFRASPRAGRWD